MKTSKFTDEQIAMALRQAEAVGAAVAETTAIGVQGLHDELRDTVGLVRRVVAQTRARVLKGDTHYPDKVLSLFEPPPRPSARARWPSRRSSARWS